MVNEVKKELIIYIFIIDLGAKTLQQKNRAA